MGKGTWGCLSLLTEDFNSQGSVSGWEHLGGCHSMARVAPRLALLSQWLTQCGGGELKRKHPDIEHRCEGGVEAAGLGERRKRLGLL